jgi:hypothetical protein
MKPTVQDPEVCCKAETVFHSPYSISLLCFVFCQLIVSVFDMKLIT